MMKDNDNDIRKSRWQLILEAGTESTLGDNL